MWSSISFAFFNGFGFFIGFSAKYHVPTAPHTPYPHHMCGTECALWHVQWFLYHVHVSCMQEIWEIGEIGEIGERDKTCDTQPTNVLVQMSALTATTSVNDFTRKWGITNGERSDEITTAYQIKSDQGSSVDNTLRHRHRHCPHDNPEVEVCRSHNHENDAGSAWGDAPNTCNSIIMTRDEEVFTVWCYEKRKEEAGGSPT